MITQVKDHTHLFERETDSHFGSANVPFKYVCWDRGGGGTSEMRRLPRANEFELSKAAASSLLALF